MKKTLLTILVLSALLLVVLYINKKQTIVKNTTPVNNIVENTTSVNNINEPVLYSGSGPFNYKNITLQFSFTSNTPIFERSPSGEGYKIISDNSDPHFYQDKKCAFADSKVPDCIAFEIQQVKLAGQKKEDIVNALDNKIVMKNILNNEFDFYKQSDLNSPGWSINYFAVNKTSDQYFNILSFATSSDFIEKEILPTFKQIR